jgi:hypothetical protein
MKRAFAIGRIVELSRQTDVGNSAEAGHGHQVMGGSPSVHPFAMLTEPAKHFLGGSGITRSPELADHYGNEQEHVVISTTVRTRWA